MTSDGYIFDRQGNIFGDKNQTGRLETDCGRKPTLNRPSPMPMFFHKQLDSDGESYTSNRTESGYSSSHFSSGSMLSSTSRSCECDSVGRLSDDSRNSDVQENKNISDDFGRLNLNKRSNNSDIISMDEGYDTQKSNASEVSNRYYNVEDIIPTQTTFDDVDSAPFESSSVKRDFGFTPSKLMSGITENDEGYGDDPFLSSLRQLAESMTCNEPEDKEPSVPFTYNPANDVTIPCDTPDSYKPSNDDLIIKPLMETVQKTSDISDDIVERKDVSASEHTFGCIPVQFESDFRNTSRKFENPIKFFNKPISTTKKAVTPESRYRSIEQQLLPRPRITKEVARLYTQDNDGDNLLMMAIMNRNLEVSSQIIKQSMHQNHLNQVNLYRQSALILAALHDMPLIVRPIIIGGGRVDVIDTNGDTALHIACRNGSVQCTRLITQPFHHSEFKDAKYPTCYQRLPQDLEAPNCEGIPCLHLAAKFFLETGRFDGLEVIQILVRRGADINVQERKSGRTLLHMAAENGSRDLLTFLISLCGLDLEAMTFARQTAASLAYGRGHYYIVEELRKNGAEVGDAADSDEVPSDDDNDVEMANGF